MTERPILFSAPMIRALLAGTKTVTRRIVKPQPEHLQRYEYRGKLVYEGEHRLWCWNGHTYESLIDFGECNEDRKRMAQSCPYGEPGDRLWCRETHARFCVGEGMDRPVPECVAYRATCEPGGSFDYVRTDGEILNLKVTKWTPAIHMPRWASRITLEVVSVRVERLHEITEDDAKREGVEIGGHPHYRSAFAELWDEINYDRAPWKSNPWVWRVEAQIR